MTAAEILLAVMWVGLTLYAVLGGADFAGNSAAGNSAAGNSAI